MSSKHFSENQLKAVLKLGNIIIPGDEKLPSFENSKVINQLDRMLDYMNKDDLEGISSLMTFFYYFPAFLIKWILLLSEKNQQFPHFIGAPLRMVQLGLKGIIFSLYYSDIDENGSILDQLNWKTEIKMNPEDLVSSDPVLRLTNPSKDEILEIFEAANQGRVQIRRLSVIQRTKLIQKLRFNILKSKDEIISEIQKDTRKCKSDALISEIFGVLDFLVFLENESVNALKDTIVKTPIALLGKKSKIYHDALGTLLIISPWNYPFYQAIVPMMISFVTGNATIYKPSEFTPLKGIIEKLLSESGFDPKWIQIVYGDGSIGTHLIEQRPDKIFFTGSVATGKKIMKQASEQLIPVELELGGKDAAIVFEDVNIKRAAAGIVWGALTNSGQSCTSVERVFIHEKIYDDFKKETLKICEKIKQLIDQDGDSDIGEMTTESQIKLVKEHLEDALEKGAVLLTKDTWDRVSSKIPPLLIEKISSDMRLAKEETFGPVIPLYKFCDESEAIKMTNDSEFGLSASVWSADKLRAERVARRLEVGNVSINNVMLTEGNPYLPFGGVKNSGIGRFKGLLGFHAFCNIKSVLIDSDSQTIEVNWYPYTKKKYDLFGKMTIHAFTSGAKSFLRFALTGMSLESYSNKIGKKGR
jgi:acyl-CoA reductase-like NAD-dependent aldehyde dehydrogenase